MKRGGVWFRGLRKGIERSEKKWRGREFKEEEGGLKR